MTNANMPSSPPPPCRLSSMTGVLTKTHPLAKLHLVFFLFLAIIAGLSDAFVLRRPAQPVHRLSSNSLTLSSSSRMWSIPPENVVDVEYYDEAGKERLIDSYRKGQYSLTAVGLLLFLLPDSTGTLTWASKYGAAAGYGMAAGLCHILKEACTKDRLGSETYQRLNLGLAAFGLVSLLALPGEAVCLLPTASSSSFVSTTGLLFMTMTRLNTAMVGWRGWCRGTMHAVSRLDELKTGTLTTLQGLRVKYAKKALTYRNILLLVSMACVSSFMQGLFNLRYQKVFKRGWFETSLEISAVARLLMLCTMIYSLKDAAERERLTGSTFIVLNIMVGAWATLVGMGQTMTRYGFAASRGVEMFALAMPFFLKAFKAQKEKQQTKLGSSSSSSSS